MFKVMIVCNLLGVYLFIDDMQNCIVQEIL